MMYWLMRPIGNFERCPEEATALIHRQLDGLKKLFSSRLDLRCAGHAPTHFHATKWPTSVPLFRGHFQKPYWFLNKSTSRFKFDDQNVFQSCSKSGGGAIPRDCLFLISGYAPILTHFFDVIFKNLTESLPNVQITRNFMPQNEAARREGNPWNQEVNPGLP